MNRVVIHLLRDKERESIALSVWDTPYCPSTDEMIKINLNVAGGREIVVEGVFRVRFRMFTFSYVERTFDTLVHLYVLPVSERAKATTQNLTKEDGVVGYDYDGSGDSVGEE